MKKTDNKRLKLFNVEIKTVDEEKRQITFCFSDDKEDRQGEIVDQASWQTDNYMKNPIILWGHDPSEPENVLGTGMNLDLNNNGRSFITAQFDDEDTNPKAAMVFKQLVRRTLRCVSAGFINHSWEVEEDTPVLKDNELLEVSIVPIPANPRAIALALKDGSLNTKDARWMMDSMRKEADLLETQLKNEKTNESGESMDELKSQIAALTESMTKIAESVNTVADQNAAIVAKFEADEAAAAEAEKLAAEKEAAEKKAEEEAKAAAEKEAAEKKATEEAEAERIAKEEADKKKLEEDTAKGGSNDQSGAGADEFDEDAELTEEEQAQIDAELEEALAN